MTRIVVFGDSLPLPRPSEDGGEAVYWEETWPWRLQRLLEGMGHPNEVINCSQRDRTVESFAGGDFLEHIAWKLPNVVVFQLGVVDCGPRIFSRLEKRLMNLPVVPARLREKLIDLRAARRREITAKDPLAKVNVRPDAFRAAIAGLGPRLSTLPSRPLCFWVPILCNPAQMEEKSPGFSRNVTLYNDIIRESAPAAGYRYVDHQTERADFWADGYHLSAAGNARLGATLAALLAKEIALAPAMPRRFDRAP